MRARALSTGRGDGAGAAAVRAAPSGRRTCEQADLLHAVPLQYVKQAYDVLVARILISGDDDGLLPLVLLLLDPRQELRLRDANRRRLGLTIENKGLVGIQRDLERRDRDERFATDGRQLDRGVDQRRGDHEDHQQHQHHVDIRNDVDVVEVFGAMARLSGIWR